MQHIAFVALAPVVAAVLLVVAVVSWRRRATPPAVTLLILVFTTFAWLSFNTLELLSSSPSTTLRWARITYIFVAATPVAWLAFAAEYVDRGEWLRPARLVMFTLVPTITVLMTLTNPSHGLVWAEYQLLSVEGLLDLWIVEYGPWFWVSAVYGYSCILLGAALILGHCVRRARLYRLQSWWIVAGALCPLMVNFAYVFRLIPGWTKDYSPLAMAFAGLAFAVGIFRHRLLHLRPVGRSQLVESMRDGMIVIDEDQQVVDVNPAALAMLGKGQNEVIGEQVSDVLPVALSLSDILPSGTAATEDLSVKMNGRERSYELRVTDIGEGNAGRIGSLIVLHDVTERIETTKQLRQQERLAAIGRLAGGIAHDFNNLLASILLHAQLAERKLHEEARGVDGDLDVIVQESRRAADLVAQILDFSRSEVRRSEPLDLGILVEEVAGVLRRTIQENIRVVVDVSLPGCVVDADPTRIHQMLLNLATNARDAMPDGGELRISLARAQSAPGAGASSGGLSTEEWVRLTLSDTGTGISEEVEGHLFEPFYTTKAPGRGTGLGLAQVYGIVKQHGGSVDVESKLGQGTAFHVYLPLHDGLLPAEASEERSVMPRGRGETILLVEDQEKLRAACRQTLSLLGYDVLTAADGRQALDVLSGRPVHLVITDLVMPNMGGKALMRELTRRAPGLPVLAVTGYAMKSEIENLRTVGFSGVLRKPFDTPTLAQAVHRNLNSGSQSGPEP